jgi:hypothetical protein
MTQAKADPRATVAQLVASRRARTFRPRRLPEQTRARLPGDEHMFVGGGPRQFRPSSFERPLVRKGTGGLRHQSGCGRSARRRMTSLPGLDQPCAQCLPAKCRTLRDGTLSPFLLTRADPIRGIGVCRGAVADRTSLGLLGVSAPKLVNGTTHARTLAYTGLKLPEAAPSVRHAAVQSAARCFGVGRRRAAMDGLIRSHGLDDSEAGAEFGCERPPLVADAVACGNTIQDGRLAAL